jgi:transaldolase
MEFFLDTSDIDEIKEFIDLGIIDGVTTNPSLLSKTFSNTKKGFQELIKEICDTVEGPVSVEVSATDYKTMMEEAIFLADISEHIVIKLPITIDGIKTCNELAMDGIFVNMTLCFSAAQALLAAKAGATYVSPFIGRLDDFGMQGVNLISDIKEIFSKYMDIETKILAASIRTPIHVIDVARLGADVITMPPKILKDLFKHPLTEIGIKKFEQDWQKAGLRII